MDLFSEMYRLALPVQAIELRWKLMENRFVMKQDISFYYLKNEFVFLRV
jgi:hypothetical protein